MCSLGPILLDENSCSGSPALNIILANFSRECPMSNCCCSPTVSGLLSSFAEALGRLYEYSHVNQPVLSRSGYTSEPSLITRCNFASTFQTLRWVCIRSLASQPICSSVIACKNRYPSDPRPHCKFLPLRLNNISSLLSDPLVHQPPIYVL